MSRPIEGLLLALLAAASGGASDSASAQAPKSKQGDDLDACTLLTADEIRTAAGWVPDTMIAKTHGTTKTCAIHGPNAVKQSIVLIVARPAPKVSTSAELAERRTRDAARTPEIKMKFTPLDGLGMPAVRSEFEGSSRATLELIVGNRVLGLTAPELAAAKALAPKAAARLK